MWFGAEFRRHGTLDFDEKMCASDKMLRDISNLTVERILVDQEDALKFTVVAGKTTNGVANFALSNGMRYGKICDIAQEFIVFFIGRYVKYTLSFPAVGRESCYVIDMTNFPEIIVRIGKIYTSSLDAENDCFLKQLNEIIERRSGKEIVTVVANYHLGTRKTHVLRVDDLIAQRTNPVTRK